MVVDWNHSFVRLVEQEVGAIENRAVGGSTAETHLQHITAYTGAAANVLWLSGYNDMRFGTPLADYESYLRSGLTILQERGCRVYLGTCLRMTEAGYETLPPDWNHGSDVVVASIIAIERQVAAEFSSVVIAETSAGYNPANVDADLIHPNDTGHFEIAAEFVAAIGVG